MRFSTHHASSAPEPSVSLRGGSVAPETLCEAFQATAQEFAHEVALRTPDDSLRLTWAQYAERVERVARGLTRLGVDPGETVALMVANRPEFHILDTAALHLGATPFSIYDTSTVEQIAHVFENAGNSTVVTEIRHLQLVRAAMARSGAVEHVVVIDGPAMDAIALEDLEASGAAEFDFAATWQAVTSQDMATLIYTSGTTGPPKGVMLSHANLIWAWQASAAALPILNRRGRYVSYLPTAHLADRVFSHYPAMVNGSSITCVDDPRAAVGQLGSIKPTMWLAVPRIWEKLKDALEAALADADDPHALRPELPARFGLDSADLLVSAAAPIRTDVLEFFAELGVEIREGYGMTECTAVATLTDAGDRPGTVGRPLPGVELRLATDGEVLLRGPGVMVGYRGEPDKTAEAIDVEGWLHTGDIGAMEGDGPLRIVDRKKELIINAAGKNMSPANIEARLKAASPLIGHAVAIGDRRPYNAALLVLDPDSVALYAHRHGITDAAPAELAEDEGVRALLAAAVEEANSHLSRVEQVKRFSVLGDDWDAGSDVLTPTLKLKRRPIADKYADVIDAMYATQAEAAA